MADKQKKRRQYGTGSITQRPDGRWVGRIDAGFTTTGNRRVKSVVRKTEAEAKRALKDLVRDIEKGQIDLDRRTTVKAWCDEWISREQSRVSPEAFTSNRSAVTQWIIPTIGHRKLTDLTAGDIRKMHKAIADAGRASSTAKRHHDVLHKILVDARREGHTVPIVATDIPAPSVGISDRDAMPVEDALKVLAVSSRTRADRSRWAAALLEGMRQAECLGLTWDRVDLDKGVIDVSWQRKTLTWQHGCNGSCGRKRGVDCPQRGFVYPAKYEVRHMHGRVHWARPKTLAGKRIIPLVPALVDALQEWKLVAPHSNLGLVWPRADGLSRDEDDDLLTWKQIQALATVVHPAGRRYVLHEARHTTATVLLALKVDPEVIRAIMGHSTILSTRAYQHVDLELMRGAMDGLSNRLQLSA